MLYLIVLIGPMLFSFWANRKVKKAFNKWSQVLGSRNVTGAQVAQQICDYAGLHDVKIEQVGGFLADHYDPRSKTLRLSEDVYHGTSVAAQGVAAHEVGHAIQHANNYWPLQFRSYIAPVASFASNISMILIMIGFLIGLSGLAKLGVLFFAVTTVFVLITLPVEFDASNRAKELLPRLGITQGSEGAGVASVLDAAAMTYVASAVSSVTWLLYYVLQAGFLGGDD